MYFLEFVRFVVLAVPMITLAGTVTPSFRGDYLFNSGSQAFYKVHREKLSWHDAVRSCAAEGAQLAAPTTKAGLVSLSEHMIPNETDLIWLGIHCLYASGYFVTLSGVPTSRMYINWGNDEPNNWNSDECCVQLTRQLIFGDTPCTSTNPFICQVDLSTLTKQRGNKVVGPVIPFFREDYVYESAFRAFYKPHRRMATWSEAVFECEAEGAELVAPDSEAETRMLLKYMTWSSNSAMNIVWLGIHDRLTEGEFVTLNGTRVSRTYINWARGEPNNVNGDENCARLLPEGVHFDDSCERYWRFICKKHLSAVTSSNPLCETYDTEYIYSLDADRCYKVHTTPRNWHDAFKICQAEGSFLGIINSQEEVNIYKGLLQNYTATPELFNNSLIHLGFNDILSHGEFVTINGETLQQSGYDVWSSGQPDSAGGNERCGSLLLKDGRLNDVGCQVEAIFICEKNILRPISLDSSLRYGRAEVKFCT